MALDLVIPLDTLLHIRHVIMRYQEPTTGLKYPLRSSELSEPRFGVVDLSVTNQ